MRCRSYRHYGDVLARNLQIDPLAVNDSPKTQVVKRYVIDYQNNTLKRVLDSDKNNSKISTSP